MAISSCSPDHISFCCWNMAAIRCSSVMLLFICERAFAAGFGCGLVDGGSFREEFLALIGILPVMYRAALPAPGLVGGSRRAMIDVERGIIVVSSSYSEDLSVCLI